MAEKITTRAEDYSQWHLDIVQQAGLAENSDVRRCTVVKPAFAAPLASSHRSDI